MGGRGPAPKDPIRRAGHSGPILDGKTIQFIPSEQPNLPTDIDWHPQVLIWWDIIGRSPQAVHFMEIDWNWLVDTALLRDSYWRKANFNVAAELRLRDAKIGATLEDRSRLKMVMADADEKDAKRPSTAQTSRQRYGDLKAI